MNIPKQIVFRFVDALGFTLIKTPVASTHKQELAGLPFSQFLNLYIEAQDLSDFFFVQVGAFDGISNDAVHEFVKRTGMNGLIIEPQAAMFRALTQNYAGCDNLIFENGAIGSENGEKPLYRIRKDLAFLSYVNQAASFNRTHTERLLKHHITKQASPEIKEAFGKLNLKFEECIEAEPVQTYKFSSLLEKHSISRFDFLQIDTEGFDYEVLKMSDIERYRPTLINFEHEHLSTKDRDAAWGDLQRFGYQIFTHGGETAAYPVSNRKN